MPATAIELVAADDPDARWCLARYHAELAERFAEGFDLARHPAPSAAELAPPRGAFVVARRGGRPVGCGALVSGPAGVGVITRMWVAKPARGAGLGARILVALEGHARELGCELVRLDTNRALVEARALYLKHGYREVERFNDNPYAHHWFEKEL